MKTGAGSGSVSPLRLELRPEDVGAVIAVPFSFEAYRASRRRNGLAAAAFSWGRYRDEHEIPWFEQAFRMLSHHGFSIVLNARFDDWGTAFQLPHRLVILIAHCHDLADGSHEIEFVDGFAGFDAVEAAVRRDFEGIVDLSACNPRGLEARIKARAPRCRVVLARRKLVSKAWLLYTVHFLAELAANGKAAWADLDKVATERIVSKRTPKELHK